MPLEFIYNQIIANYINRREDLYKFIFINHKCKDAALSLKVNSFPLIQYDEIRFPNIETQYIYNISDMLLVYPNKKLKYIYKPSYIMQFHCSKPTLPSINADDKSLKSKTSTDKLLLSNKIDLNYKNKGKFIDFSKTNSIYLFIKQMTNIMINRSFDNLTKLIIKNVDRNNTINKLEIRLPSLKLLIIYVSNDADIILNTPNLNILEVPSFKTLAIEQHNLICFSTEYHNKASISCNFKYPFICNSVKCRNDSEYAFLMSRIDLSPKKLEPSLLEKTKIADRKEVKKLNLIYDKDYEKVIELTRKFSTDYKHVWHYDDENRLQFRFQ